MYFWALQLQFLRDSDGPRAVLPTVSPPFEKQQALSEAGLRKRMSAFCARDSKTSVDETSEAVHVTAASETCKALILIYSSLSYLDLCYLFISHILCVKYIKLTNSNRSNFLS